MTRKTHVLGVIGRKQAETPRLKAGGGVNGREKWVQEQIYCKKNHEVGVGGEKQAENPRWEAEGHAWRRK